MKISETNQASFVCIPTSKSLLLTFKEEVQGVSYCFRLEGRRISIQSNQQRGFEEETAWQATSDSIINWVSSIQCHILHIMLHFLHFNSVTVTFAYIFLSPVITSSSNHTQTY
jgi:hypothetical protein